MTPRPSHRHRHRHRPPGLLLAACERPQVSGSPADANGVTSQPFAAPETTNPVTRPLAHSIAPEVSIAGPAKPATSATGKDSPTSAGAGGPTGVYVPRHVRAKERDLKREKERQSRLSASPPTFYMSTAVTTTVSAPYKLQTRRRSSST
ncbi:unnamed protein product [Vitrella brassicaformis CCMP3155]|uniref:Uncharacterized protein n=1 Tax=Vitrella brassicaformis (strain CCMP3155) TaxID=1169540 RepID=A0A0G4FF99_VITBC|nr:unnamed protein product [Vitrella brassicaformis CCMP3155]|eukprot:CEM11870.1 unnamed protein product [Vitrella brassicaformis CCMP3155]